MPGNYQLSVDTLVGEVGAALDKGIAAFILFGIPTHKDPVGSSALEDEGMRTRVLYFLFARRCVPRGSPVSIDMPSVCAKLAVLDIGNCICDAAARPRRSIRRPSSS